MAQPPTQPRNADVVSDKGQFNQAHSRWWDKIAKQAYSAIQSFNEIFQLDTISEAVDSANDYLLIYNASDNAAQKIAVDNILASGTPTVIETITLTATASVVFDDIPADYSRLLFLVSGASKNSSVGALIAEFSTDNGSSYITSGVAGAVSSNIGAGAGVAGWVNGQAFVFYIDNSLSHNGFVTIDDYAQGSTIPKRIISAGNRTSLIRSEGQGVIFGVGAINAVRLTLSNFTANGSITLIGYP